MHWKYDAFSEQEMKELDEAAKKNGLVFMNEIGVDPGIDHMSAMKVIDRIRESGGKIILFESFTGGLISVAGSPITGSGTLALTVAGTSGGVPYFTGASTWASSAALSANALMIGGGAGVAPSTTTTGTGARAASTADDDAGRR